MPEWNLPAFRAAAQQPWLHKQQMRMHYSSPGSSLWISHSSASKWEPPLPFPRGNGSGGQNGRQGMLPAWMAGRGGFPAPSLCLGAKGTQGSIPFPLPARETTGPPVLPQPGRLRFPQAGKIEQAGIFLFVFERQVLAVRVSVCVSHGKPEPMLGLCGLGSCLWARIVSGELFLLDLEVNYQADPYPFELS